ncbi:MAG TPA: hypothetical protein ENF87_02365, partial [Thermoproteales archaeon]|nr:hypothetical protein [Thermoproteales archaeon]
LIILNTTKLVYNGLEIANLTLIEVDGYYNVNGEVRNLGNETMETVYIILFTYNPDGEIANHYYQTLSKLSPGESKTFSFQKALTVNQTFRIFAVGSHGYMDVENTKIMELLTQIEELNQTRIKVQVLTDRDYYYSLSKDIRNANQSILVVMYSMVYDPDDPFDWANNLIRELAEASKRGVNVTVIIEYRTYYGYMSKNLEAYNYLLSQGVNVKLDQEPDTDHLKLVIIDHKIVYIGSHNWSEAALYYNHETSIKIVNKGVANILEQYTQTKF